jgi:RND superfamily putative drug exporter
VLFWIGGFMVAGMFAGNLEEVQNNEAQSWLPESAESTQVLNVAVHEVGVTRR